MGFYSVAAQIIPVLLLALIVERRLVNAQDAVDPVLDLLVVAMFILGETLALWAVAGGRTGPGVLAWVATPLAIGAIGLVEPAVSHRETLPGPRGSRHWPATRRADPWNPCRIRIRDLALD